MRSIILFFAVAVSGCNESESQVANTELDNMIAADAAGFDSPALPPTDEGTAIPVSSDPRASYRLLRKSRLANSNLEVLTRRDGPSGTSFARREINCGDMTFRYLGEGDTLEEAEKDGPNPGELSEAMSTSISGEVARFACR